MGPFKVLKKEENTLVVKTKEITIIAAYFNSKYKAVDDIDT